MKRVQQPWRNGTGLECNQQDLAVRGGKSVAAAFDDQPARAASASPSGAHGRLQAYQPDTEVLNLLGGGMLRAARQHGQPLALLVVAVADLPELEILFGRDAANQAVQAVMTELSALAGNAGLSLRTTADTFVLLIPRCTGDQVQRALRARLGRAYSVEIEFGDEEIVLVPDVQACTVEASESVGRAYCALCRAIESRRYLDQLRRGELRREREAHSTHTGLPRELADAPAVRASHGAGSWSRTIPATIAMPLGLAAPGCPD